jgi:diguanylate cyclase (GGDEF)-like protein/PAS domain S-box-containing protein
VSGIFSRYLAFASIRVKLWLLIVLNSSLALALAAAGMLAYQRHVQRDEAAHKLIAQANILAEGSTAPLSFDDATAARETLGALRGDPQVVEAILYSMTGAVFARYERGSAEADEAHAQARPDGVYFEGGSLLTFEPVRVHGDRIGTIFLRATNDVNGQLRRYLQIMLLVVAVSLGLAMFLSSGMQGMIATPIKELSRVARQVTAEKDYSVRALTRSGAEIGILIESFNGMLAEIESRDLARRAAEELLRESEQRYALAARGANDGLWDWKLATNEIYFSPRWNQMLGYGEPGVRPEPEEWFSRIHPSDRERVEAEIAAHRKGATSEFTSEYRMRHRNGSFIWMLSRGAVVRDETGRAIRMAGSQTDITEGKIGDPLTGLPNRLYFLDRLEDSIQKEGQKESQREKTGGIGFAVLFVDLDRFKLVNDSLGHAAGDELLMGISRRLKASVRESATGSERRAHHVVARLGGDEFAVLLSGIRQISDAVGVADRILASLSAPFQIAGRQVFGTVSIGIAPGSAGSSPEDLLRDADAAMYYAKTKGKARCEVFDEGMRDRAKARLEIETDLRRAIDLNQLVLYYQPQMSLTNNRVVGYEALVRWQHPERGLVPPSEFIPVAEETDLIVPLGRWVLREACRQMALWHRSFAVQPALTVSVNVSFRQLGDANLVDEVRKALRESGLPPESLKLEMTESSIMSNTEMAIGVLRQLKEIGVGLEIDDFGTGYSSLSNLSRLPFDTVKIDQSFVKDLHASGESAEIVRTILDLARSMGMSVVAEGVETVDQLGVLTSLGCDYAQGYYFSRPVDKDSTQALLRERHSLRRAFAQLETQPDSETPGQPGAGAKVLELLDTL